MASISWLEKYRPTKFSDYLNYKDYEKIVKEWIKPFLTEDNNSTTKICKTAKPYLILYGPPAYGKTTLAHCILNEYDYEPLECNASDTRNKTQLQKRITTGKCSFTMNKAGTALRPYGLILDELDGLTSGDNGGIDAIMNTVFFNNTKPIKNREYSVRYPVICTTNSIKEKKLLPILKFGYVVNMVQPSKNMLFKLALMISKNEQIPITQAQIKDFITKDDDYRSIITKLHNIYLDCCRFNHLKKRKQYIKEYIINYKQNIVINGALIRINDKSIHEIINELIRHLPYYNKRSVYNVIDSNNQTFYMSMLCNYYKLNDLELINKLINIIYDSSKFINYYNKNKIEHVDINKFVNYCHTYSLIWNMYNKLQLHNNDLKNNTKDKLKSNKRLVLETITYHKRYNDMKQDKAYYYNNLHNNYIYPKNNKIINSVIEKTLYKTKITTKKNMDNNIDVFNNIIDIDIINMYNIMNRELSDSNNINEIDYGFNKTFTRKLNSL